MKQNYLISMILLFITSGCTVAIHPPTPQALVAKISSTLTQSANATAAFVNSTPTASVTPTPEIQHENDAKIIFRDDFNTELESDWQWLNEDPTTWSVDVVPGSLLIQAESGSINLGTAKNVLLRSAPTEDFIAETSISFIPNESDQFAGIILLESEQNYIQAGLGYCIPEVGCSRQAFYIDVYNNGKYTLPRHPISNSIETMLVRLEVQNQALSVFTSPNGRVWYRIFQQQMDFIPIYVGLFAGQNYHPLIIPATFGYFEIRTFK